MRGRQAEGLEGDAAQWLLSLPELPVRELAARIPTREGVRVIIAAAGPALQALRDQLDNHPVSHPARPASA